MHAVILIGLGIVWVWEYNARLKGGIMATKVYGASDDLIEFDGDLRGEVGCYGTDEKEHGVLVVFSDGTLLDIQYGKHLERKGSGNSKQGIGSYITQRSAAFARWSDWLGGFYGICCPFPLYSTI